MILIGLERGRVGCGVRGAACGGGGVRGRDQGGPGDLLQQGLHPLHQEAGQEEAQAGSGLPD